MIDHFSVLLQPSAAGKEQKLNGYQLYGCLLEMLPSETAEWLHENSRTPISQNIIACPAENGFLWEINVFEEDLAAEISEALAKTKEFYAQKADILLKINRVDLQSIKNFSDIRSRSAALMEKKNIRLNFLTALEGIALDRFQRGRERDGLKRPAAAEHRAAKRLDSRGKNDACHVPAIFEEPVRNAVHAKEVYRAEWIVHAHGPAGEQADARDGRLVEDRVRAVLERPFADPCHAFRNGHADEGLALVERTEANLLQSFAEGRGGQLIASVERAGTRGRRDA